MNSKTIRRINIICELISNSFITSRLKKWKVSFNTSKNMDFQQSDPLPWRSHSLHGRLWPLAKIKHFNHHHCFCYPGNEFSRDQIGIIMHNGFPQRKRLRDLLRQRNPGASHLSSLCPENHTEEEGGCVASCLFPQILNTACLLLLLHSLSPGKTLNSSLTKLNCFMIYSHCDHMQVNPNFTLGY